MIVDERADRVAAVETALRESDCAVVGTLIGREDLEDEIARLDPDVILIDMESPDRDVLEDMSRLNAGDRPRPTVMFVDRSDGESIRAAVEAGVSAYVVDGLNASRVRPILEVAIARFHEFQKLRQELLSVKETLADRKIIERAKGLLMKHRSMTEQEAYDALRKLAMNRKTRLASVAREVVKAAELLAAPRG